MECVPGEGDLEAPTNVSQPHPIPRMAMGFPLPFSLPEEEGEAVQSSEMLRGSRA
jgi:hypothetical protein